MKYQFKYQLNDKDYLSFNKYHVYHSRSNKKVILALRLIIPLIFVTELLLFHKSYQENGTLVITSVIFSILSVIWFLSARSFLMLIMKINITMIKKDGRLPYSKDVQIELEETSFTEITKEAETKVPYTSIEKVGIDNRAIYIYISAIQAFIIPFSIFKDEEQRKGFLTFLKDKIGINKDGSSGNGAD